MGLFDFAKDIGNKIFSKEDEAPVKVKQHIEESNPGINDLDIQFNVGTVSLSGEADSAEAMEKAVLMAGNIQGVSGVAADNLTSPPPAQKVEYYTIVK